MAVPSDSIVEVRDELIVSPAGNRRCSSRRRAHFLKPTAERLHSLSLSPSPPVVTEDFAVTLKGWLSPHPGWREWADRLMLRHRHTWERAGILEPIVNSTYRVFRAPDLIVEIAKKWRPETNTFVFGFAEATVTLEDVMIAGGYSVVGSPVFMPSGADDDATGELSAKEARLEEERLVLVRTRAKKAGQSAWFRHFTAEESSGRDVEHEAFLTLWLARFVFPGGPFDTIPKIFFPLAARLAAGTRYALAPAILAAIYRDLTLLRRKLLGETNALSAILATGGVRSGSAGIILWAPLQLVMLWVWERFILMQPGPNRATWHETTGDPEAVAARVFGSDSGGEYFLWRPYTVGTWTERPGLQRLYGERPDWRRVVPGSADLYDESFARCLRPSELVGVDPHGRLFIEHYFPNRVARQFGFDQDVPGDVARTSSGLTRAWENYNRPIGAYEVYFPDRFFTGGVTPRYLEWWDRAKSQVGAGPNDPRKWPRSGRFEGYEPKLTLERVILPAGRAQDETSEVPRSRGARVPGTKPTLEQVFGLRRKRPREDEASSSGPVSPPKTKNSGKATVRVRISGIFGVEDKVFDSLETIEDVRDESRENTSYCYLGVESDHSLFPEISEHLQPDFESVDDRIVFTDENGGRSCPSSGPVGPGEPIDLSHPPGFKRKHDDRVLEAKEKTKNLRTTSVGESDLPPPPGFTQKHGNGGGKGVELGLEGNAPENPKVVDLEDDGWLPPPGSTQESKPVAKGGNSTDSNTVMPEGNGSPPPPPESTRESGIVAKGVNSGDSNTVMPEENGSPPSPGSTAESGSVAIGGNSGDSNKDRSEGNGSSPPPGSNRKDNDDSARTGKTSSKRNWGKPIKIREDDDGPFSYLMVSNSSRNNPIMINVEGVESSAREASEGASRPALGFWKMWARAKTRDPKGGLIGLFEMARPDECAPGDLIENEAAAMEGLRSLGAEIIKVQADLEEKEESDEVLVYVPEKGEWVGVNDSGQVDPPETRGSLGNPNPRVKGKAVEIPDLNL